MLTLSRLSAKRASNVFVVATGSSRHMVMAPAAGQTANPIGTDFSDSSVQTASELATAQSRRARQAFAKMSVASLEKRNHCLAEMEAQLAAREQEIYEANERDMTKEAARGGATGRLSLKGKIGTLCEGLKQVRNLPDFLGNVTLSRELADGLKMYRTSTPLGVLLIIFEARPDAAVQIFSLAMKTGNTVILKGGSEATETLLVLEKCMKDSLAAAGLPSDASQLVIGREAVKPLLGPGLVDLVIPRGSNALVKSIKETTSTPVLGHADGICHAYVDKAANLEMASRIIRDSKTNYPAACNAVETVLVHTDVAAAALPKLAEALHDCKIHACPRSSAILGDRVVPASGDDFRTEWGDLTLCMKVVDNQAEAMDHIRDHGSSHTDVIVTDDVSSADHFVTTVDSAGVFVNSSTRFADGFRYGFGAEVGISTSKIHARGPVGLEGLLSYKYHVYGNGHTVGEPNPTQFTHKDIAGVKTISDVKAALAPALRSSLPKAKRILVKVGSGVLTRSKGGGLALARIANLVEQLAQLVHSGREVLLVSSGGVATGRHSLKEARKTQLARADKDSIPPIPSKLLPQLDVDMTVGSSVSDSDVEATRRASAAGQGKMTSLYETCFGVHDMHIAQILISKTDLAYTKSREQGCGTIMGLMKQGIIPIVNENDVMLPANESVDGDGSIDKKELPITDNDSIAAVLAVELKCDLVILLSEVDGVYPSMEDPTPIPVLTEASMDKIKYGAKSSVGRGGMDSKVAAATYMMRRGVQVVICNGMKTQSARTVLDVVKGENTGTLFTK